MIIPSEETLDVCTTILEKEQILQVLDNIESCATEMGFKHKEALFIKLATEEACINAWEYCESKNYSTFTVGWKCQTGEFIEVLISHEGEKYRIEKDHTINEGQRGRGLQLILAIMDIVKVSKCLQNVCMYMRKDLRKGGIER